MSRRSHPEQHHEGIMIDIAGLDLAQSTTADWSRRRPSADTPSGPKPVDQLHIDDLPQEDVADGFLKPRLTKTKSYSSSKYHLL